MQEPDELFREIRVIFVNDQKVLSKIYKTNPEVGKTPRDLIRQLVDLDIKSVVPIHSRNLYVAKVIPTESGNMDNWATLEDLSKDSDYLDFDIAVNYEEFLRRLTSDVR
jgi:hypothetical protein